MKWLLVLNNSSIEKLSRFNNLNENTLQKTVYEYFFNEWIAKFLLQAGWK